MKLDWKNIDWSALLHSQVAVGSIVAVISGAVAITGHVLPPDQQTVITHGVTEVFQGLGEIATLYTLYHRVAAQPEGQTVIVPTKDTTPIPPPTTTPTP